MDVSPTIERAFRLGAAGLHASGSAGRDPQESLEFELMMDQVRRFESSGEADWNEIARLAEVILERDGYDLRAATHRTFALGRLSGWTGWSQGMATIASIIDNHWPERVFPRPDSSSRVVVALLRRVAERIVRLPSPGREEVADASVAVAALVASLRKRWCSPESTANPATASLIDAGSALVALLEPLERTLQAESQPSIAAADTPPPDPPANREQPTMETRAPQRAAEVLDADPADAVAVERLVGQLADRQRSAALALLLHRPFDPRPYLLLRASAWSNAESVEIDSSSGALRVRAPEASARLPDLPDSPAPEDLTASERRVAASPFWLDLSVRTTELLGCFGSKAEKARTAILSELTSLLRRCPVLRTATFSDGRPLLTLQVPVLDSPPAVPSGRLSDRDTDTAPGMPGHRGRFLDSLDALRRAPLDPLVKRSLLESLLDRSESIGLEEWEPSLATTLFELTLAATGQGERWERMHDRARLGLARIAPERLAGFPSRGVVLDRSSGPGQRPSARGEAHAKPRPLNRP